MLLLLGKRLMISNKNRSVRQGVIYLFTNLLLLSGIVFTLEIVLILLGIGDIFIPLTQRALGFLSGLVF